MKPPKHTEKDIMTVYYYVNNKGLTKRQAIKKAGFSDSSVFYNTLRRLDIREKIISLKKTEEDFL